MDLLSQLASSLTLGLVPAILLIGILAALPSLILIGFIFLAVAQRVKTALNIHISPFPTLSAEVSAALNTVQSSK